MKSWLSNWKRRRETNVAAELRASKPEPSARFVKMLAARINPRPAQPVRTRTRLGLAAAVTATMVAVVGATGGFSSAASTIAGATHSVAHITHVSSTPSALVRNASGPVPNHGPRSADGQYAEAPTVTGFNPESGAPGTSVTVSGTNFAGASAVTSVTLNGTPAGFSVSSNSSLTLTVPAGATSGVITVSNAAGSADSGDTFIVIQTPQFDGDTPFNPTEGGVGTPVTLNGEHFTGVNKVMIGGKAATISSLSDTEIDTSVPVGARAGAGSISVTNAAGTATATGFTVVSGAPTVSGFSPTSGEVQSSVKITGTNLDVNGTPADIMFNGAADPASLTAGKTPTNTALYVDVPADAESGQITATNSAGSGTSKGTFIVLATPHITSVSPAFGVRNTSVVIKGDTFTHAQNVIFHGGPADVTVSSGLAIKGDTQITVKAPSTLAQGSTYTLEVTGKSGDVSAASSDTFYFEQKPAIGGLDPDTGGSGQSVTITPEDGNTFLGVTKVTFGGKPAKIVDSAPDQLVVLVPAGLNSSDTPKTVPVVVSNAAGPSASASFTALNSGPTVKSVAPAAAEAGDQLTIVGTHLNNSDTTVTFLGGSSCTVANGSLTKSTTGTGAKALDTIKFDVPSCARTGALEVDNADGSATTKSETIYVQPVILGFHPAYGVSGTKIQVIGEPGTLAGAYEVDFGSFAQKSGISVAKDGGSLTVAVPKNGKLPLAADSYQVTVKVNKADGDLQGNSGNIGFTVVAKPTITDFGGDTGGTAGHSFTLTGTNLLGIDSVTFGKAKAIFQQVITGGAVDSTKLTVFVPAGATSNKVTVHNAAGSGSSSAVYPILAISKLAPASTKHGNGAVLTVLGSGFKFGGSFAGTITIGGEAIVPKAGSSDTKLLLPIPKDLAAGSQTVHIANDLGDVTATLTLT